jgi:hypothetical protein
MRFSTSVILITVPLLCLAADVPRPLQVEHKETGTIYGKFAYVDQGYPGAAVYIFTLSQGKRLREIDEDAYKRAHAPGITEGQARAIRAHVQDELTDVVSTLPHTALTKTDSKGAYAFKNLPAGRRYYLLAVQVAEDGLFLAGGITPLLKDGQKVRFDLRIDSRWEDRFRAK